MPSKRRSWLPFGNGNKQRAPNNEDETKATANETDGTAQEAGALAAEGGEERLRPIQFAPNRLATLYVTPSERNLYLAAMSQLDQGPAHLHLWSDPAPSLPQVTQSQPIQAGLPPPPAPAPARALHNNSKLITSPEAQTNGGLMVRDEFRRLPPAKMVNFASMALTGGGGLRFTRFPANVLLELEQAFPANKVLSEPAQSLAQIGTAVLPLYTVEMFGSIWRRAGNEELDPIRLLIAILTTVGTHGWTIANEIRAGGLKNDVKNLVLHHDEHTALSPPAYFAISFPLPDRISLIFPPPKATPALISAIRQAITSTTANASHSRSGTGNTVDTQTSNESQSNSKVTWKDRKAKIKLEGWVHDGVYRFWLDGMRRKLVGGVKKDVVASLQPHIVLNIISALSSMHYSLATSIPLQPTSAGRDILLFASQPDTGVAASDAFRPKAPEVQHPSSSRSESPVLVHRTSSLPSPVEASNENPRAVDSQKRRLPWTSTVMSDRHADSQPERQTPQPPSPTRDQSVAPRSQSQMQHRDASIDSARPLLNNSSVQSSPRPRNVLLKKNSLRQRTSSDGSKPASVAPRSRQHSGINVTSTAPAPTAPAAADTSAAAERQERTGGDPESWEMVDRPSNVGRLGVTMYSDFDAESRALAQSTHQTIPAPQITALEPSGRPSLDQHTSSGESVYETPAADILLNPPPPLAHQEFTSSSLPLGKPMNADNGSAVSSIPAHLRLKGPRSPNRVQNNAEAVDIGIPSVHGSLGYIPSMMSQNPSVLSPEPATAGGTHSRSASEALDLLMGHGRDTSTDIMPMPEPHIEDRKGKGKEGVKRVWDEDKGAWVDHPTAVNGNGTVQRKRSGSDGPGSARTRVSMG